MALDMGANLAKKLLKFFNIAFWLSGVAIIGVGILIISSEKTILHQIFKFDQSYAEVQYIGYACIGVGLIVFVVGFLGCCGAKREDKLLLFLYIVFLVIILLSEIVIGVLGAVYKEKVMQVIQKKVQPFFQKKYGKDIDKDFTVAVDLMQVKYQCCGIFVPEDYTNSTWKKNQTESLSVPLSCCVLGNAKDKRAHEKPEPVNKNSCQAEGEDNKEYRNQKGCIQVLKELISKNKKILMIIAFVIAAVEVLGIIFGICLFRAL